MGKLDIFSCIVYAQTLTVYETIRFLNWLLYVIYSYNDSFLTKF